MHDKERKLRQNAWTSADETVQLGKMWKRRAKNPEKNFLIWIKFSFFFTAARPISETRKYKFRARRAPKSAPSSILNEPARWQRFEDANRDEDREGKYAKMRGLTWDSLAVLSPVYLGRRWSFRSAIEARYPTCLHLLRLWLHQDRRRTCGQKDHTGFSD